MQKPTMQPKNAKNQVIDLQPVEIDVEISQRLFPHNEKLSHNCQTTSDYVACQSYNQILNETIQNILLNISQGTQPDISAFSRLSTVKKVGISYIAVLNLQFIQKLNYILLKVEQLKVQVDVEFIRNQIRHWKQQLYFAIFDIAEQKQKYGPAKTQISSTNSKNEAKQVEQANQSLSSQNSGNCMIPEDKNGEDNEQKMQNAKVEVHVQEQPNKSRQLRKSKRNGSVNKNGESASQVLCDNIDN